LTVTVFVDTACIVLSVCQYKSTAEAAVDAVRAILRLCEESKTVRRVIHTASISTTSPLKEPDASAGVYKDFISESCWTPLNVDYPLRSAHFDVSKP
jgi:thioester reductase-like protein